MVPQSRIDIFIGSLIKSEDSTWDLNNSSNSCGRSKYMLQERGLINPFIRWSTSRCVLRGEVVFPQIIATMPPRPELD